MFTTPPPKILINPLIWCLSLLLALGLYVIQAPTAPAAHRAARGLPIDPSQQQTLVFLPLISRPSLQPTAITFWGMNLYVTKRERSQTGDNRSLLADTAKAAGVQWTREELSWALVEQANGSFLTIYDTHLRLAADKGFGILGILLTTPDWARDPSCRPSREAFWCPPTDVREFAQFAAFMTERYDGDGYKDAPGSPRIAAWEIWNEPNDDGNWANIGADDHARKRRYGELLVAAYQAIKAADPTATVVLGGVYIFDGSCVNGLCDGFNFLNADGGVFRQVPEARQAFDVLATHPYATPNRPDDPNIPRIVTLEGTSRTTRSWLADPAIGRPNAPIWISELGWCTAPGTCPGDIPVSEDQQANYLIRALAITQQNGIQHVNWFQFEDAFNDPNRMWGNAAIVRNYDGSSYPPKPAYFAYRTFARQISDAVPIGTGPTHTHLYDPSQPYNNSGGTYDYRYQRGTTLIDVLWRPDDTTQIMFPVEPGKPVTLIDRDGGQTPLTPSGGTVRLTLSERPLLLVQGSPIP